MTNDQLLEFLEAAQEAARRGAAVLEEWRARFQVREKGRFDLVTDADVASQRAIRDYLAHRFPTHGFLGEEDALHRGQPRSDDPPLWIVDPLDGTTNYVHDCPMYCVSVALQLGGELVVGAVFDPTRPEMFASARGHGAWLNGRRLQTSKIDRLEEAILATGFPPDLRGQEQTLAWWRHFSLCTQSLRRTGSTALNLAYVAAGRFDGYWGFDSHVWDIAAGVVLVREAGGAVSNVHGETFNPYAPDAVASNGPLQPILLAHLRGEP
ncbi:MAG: inositol monophosphatase [Gemmataceae bacterium]|nr:inositol monophosphatase [Gemmataceae bacterium]MDW8267283.1 inositol monophosphatase family protein [Gemmataceae bacterium]